MSIILWHLGWPLYDSQKLELSASIQTHLTKHFWRRPHAAKCYYRHSFFILAKHDKIWTITPIHNAPLLDICTTTAQLKPRKMLCYLSHPQYTESILKLLFFLRIHYFSHNEMPKHNTNPDRSVCRVTPWKLSGRTHLILLIIRVRAHRYVLLDFLCVRNWCLMFDSKLPEMDDKNSYDTLVLSIISVRSQQFIWMEMVFCWHVLQLAKCPKFIMQRTND